MKYWPRIDPFFSKIQNFYPKHKIPNNQWEKLNRCHYLKFQNFLKVPYFCRINSGPIFYMSGSFYWQNHYKKPVFMFMKKLQRNPSVKSGLKIFIFRPYGFDYLRFFNKGLNKNSKSWKLLGTPRLYGFSWLC